MAELNICFASLFGPPCKWFSIIEPESISILVMGVFARVGEHRKVFLDPHVMVVVMFIMIIMIIMFIMIIMVIMIIMIIMIIMLMIIFVVVITIFITLLMVVMNHANNNAVDDVF